MLVLCCSTELIDVSQLIIQLLDTTLLVLKVMPLPVFLSSTAKS